MRKLILALALFGLVLPVHAADLGAMPVKAPPNPYTGSGWYGFVTTYVSQQSVNVNSPIPGISGTLAANGGSIGGGAGYIKSLGNGNTVSAECSAAWQNIGGSTSGGLINFNSPARVECFGMFGMSMQNLANAIPANVLNFGNIFPSLPALPAGTIASNSHPFFGLGFAAEDETASSPVVSSPSVWSFSIAAITGIDWQISPTNVVQTFAEYEGNGRAIGFGAGSPNLMPGVAGQNHKVLAGVKYKFGI